LSLASSRPKHSHQVANRLDTSYFEPRQDLFPVKDALEELKDDEGLSVGDPDEEDDQQRLFRSFSYQRPAKADSGRRQSRSRQARVQSDPTRGGDESPFVVSPTMSPEASTSTLLNAQEAETLDRF